MSTTTPAPSAEAMAAQPELVIESYRLDIHDSEYFLIRNGPIFKGTQAGILFPSRDFTVEELKKLVDDLNNLPALKKELAEVNRKLQFWGVTELSTVNPSVASCFKHWEGRAEKAEAELAAVREEKREAEDEAGCAHGLIEDLNKKLVDLESALAAKDQTIAALREAASKLLTRMEMATEHADERLHFFTKNSVYVQLLREALAATDQPRAQEEGK